MDFWLCFLSNFVVLFILSCFDLDFPFVLFLFVLSFESGDVSFPCFCCSYFIFSALFGLVLSLLFVMKFLLICVLVLLFFYSLSDRFLYWLKFLLKFLSE